MSDAAFTELAHAVLDGAATPADRAALDARIASDPRARDEWETLEAAFHALATVQPVPPPPGLTHDVMRAIRNDAATRPAPGVRAWLDRAAIVRLVSAFAAGAAAAVLVVSLATGRHPSADLPVAGTLAPGVISGAPRAAATFDAGAARATVELRSRGSIVEARVIGHANGDAVLILAHDPALVAAVIDGLDPNPASVTFARDHLAIAFTGDVRCAIRLRGTNAGATRLHVTLRSGNASRELDIAAAPGANP